MFLVPKKRQWGGKKYDLNIDDLVNIHLEWIIQDKKPYNIFLNPRKLNSTAYCLGVDNATNSLSVSPELCKANHFLSTQYPMGYRDLRGVTNENRYIAYALLLLVIFQRLAFEEVFSIMKNGGISVNSVKMYQDLQIKSSKYKAHLKKDKGTFAYIFEWVAYFVFIFSATVLITIVARLKTL